MALGHQLSDTHPGWQGSASGPPSSLLCQRKQTLDVLGNHVHLTPGRPDKHREQQPADGQLCVARMSGTDRSLTGWEALGVKVCVLLFHSLRPGEGAHSDWTEHCPQWTRVSTAGVFFTTTQTSVQSGQGKNDADCSTGKKRKPCKFFLIHSRTHRQRQGQS